MDAAQDYPAAVCVPVSTPTMLLGTLWVFCHKRRDFNDRETNMLEVVAGRLAADLERETLCVPRGNGPTPAASGPRPAAATEPSADDRAAVGRLAACRTEPAS